MRVAVVGGGIAGLAAAWELATLGGAEVTVVEPGRLGGKILTEPFRGRPVDCGPDAFVTRVPDALRLCRELGIDQELVAPSAGRALLWAKGRLVPLPDGLVLGVPRRLGPVFRSGLLSTSGLLRAGCDLLLPPTRWDGDISVGELVRRRFGREVADLLVDPLLGGIHAGSVHRLSVLATAPQLASSARAGRSLLLALRRAAASLPEGSPFLAPRLGMGRLVERLTEALAALGVEVAEETATSLRAAGAGRVVVEPLGTFDAAVVATPAAEAARLLAEASPPTASELAAIRSASVAIVTLAYPCRALRAPEGVSGLLVPRGEQKLMTACSFASAKWPQWAEPGEVVLRVSVGRDGDDRALGMGDWALLERVQDELAEALGLGEAPLEWRVSRWPGSFPQYEVGHLERVGRIERILAADLPSVRLAGASYRGAGVPACIASGRAAAASLLSRS